MKLAQTYFKTEDVNLLVTGAMNQQSLDENEKNVKEQGFQMMNSTNVVCLFVCLFNSRNG